MEFSDRRQAASLPQEVRGGLQWQGHDPVDSDGGQNPAPDVEVRGHAEQPVWLGILDQPDGRLLGIGWGGVLGSRRGVGGQQDQPRHQGGGRP